MITITVPFNSYKIVSASYNDKTEIVSVHTGALNAGESLV